MFIGGDVVADVVVVVTYVMLVILMLIGFDLLTVWQVELLFGNNEWVYPENHASLVRLIQTAVDYIVNFPVQERRDVKSIWQQSTPPTNATKSA